MLKAGVMLANRYEIVGRIGSGGMADVYKAMDHKLNRYVAVKVMKPEFQGDSTFVSKFRREAQAAAGLANPNIVNVYDVGEDQGNYYIVMELVEGITLKEYIEKKGKLSVREATSIAIQVCMGLAAAHDQGIVHRDVKPQNIIISTDGKVKVTDFGIARAASSNTISANAMGSVHYSSPEQVRGGYSDSRSDIYSLGISLYEMVTGRVPFDGETTVAIAIKHLQAEMEPPTKYTPDLPHALEQIIYKCTQKSVDRRYQSMNDVITDLKRSLMEPQGNFVQLAPLSDHAPTVLLTKKEQQEIKSAGKSGTMPPAAQTFTSIEAARRGRDESQENDDENDDDGSDESSGLEKAVTIGSFIVCGLIIFVLIFFIAKAAGLVGNSRNSGNPQPSVTSSAEVTESGTPSEESGASQIVTTVSVPSILGMTESDAQKIARDKGLGIKFAGEKFSDQAEGTIIEQDPAQGTQVERNSTISYFKSSGPETHAIPTVTGGQIGAAKEALEAAGFTNVRVEKEASESSSVGTVLSVTPAEGELVTVDSEVLLTVSRGSADAGTVRISDYVGWSLDSAYEDARQSGLIVSLDYGSSEEFGTDVIMSQTVEANTSVPMGTDITLTVNNAELYAEQEAKRAEKAGSQTPGSAPAPTEAPKEESESSEEPAIPEQTVPITTDTGSEAEASGEAASDWVAVASLLQPENYAGGPYRLMLVQNVGGQDKETLIEESSTSLAFPYTLQVTGEPGVAEGQVYLYEKSADEEYIALAAWPVSFAEG